LHRGAEKCPCRRGRCVDMCSVRLRKVPQRTGAIRRATTNGRDTASPNTRLCCAGGRANGRAVPKLTMPAPAPAMAATHQDGNPRFAQLHYEKREKEPQNICATREVNGRTARKPLPKTRKTPPLDTPQSALPCLYCLTRGHISGLSGGLYANSGVLNKHSFAWFVRSSSI
jgi:hypothetical protein